MQLRSFRRAVGRGAGGGREGVLRTYEHDRAAQSLSFQQLYALAADQKIAGGENVYVSAPEGETRLLDGRSRSNACVRHADVNASELPRSFGKELTHRILIGYID